MRSQAVERYETRGFALQRPREVHRPEGTGRLRAGAATVDLTPAIGVDVAGFGFEASRHTEGACGRLRATCLLVEGADGERVLLAATDLLAGTRYLTEALAAEVAGDLGLSVERVWLGASHTHAGPGHVFGERFYDCLAARTNDFDVDTARWMVERLAAGARAAAASLRPARVGVGAAPIWGLVWQRSLLALAANLGVPDRMSDADLERAVRTLAPSLTGHAPPEGLGAAHLGCDARVQVVWAEAFDGVPIGLIATVHGTPAVLPAPMGLLSPDAAGLAARRVHHALHRGFDAHVPVGVVAGIMGDTNLVEPTESVDLFRKRRSRSAASGGEILIGLTERVGRGLADGILRAAARARADATDEAEVQVRFRQWTIPETTGPGFRLPAEHQVGSGQFGGSELNRDPLALPAMSLATALRPSILVQRFLRWATGEPSARRRQWWWPVPVKLPVWSSSPHAPKNHLIYDLLREYGRRWFWRNPRAGDGFDPYLPVRHLRLGRHTFVGLPLEPSTVLAHRIRAAVRPEGPHEVVLWGLCGGYVGYATTVDEYRVQDYEGAATLWGRDFGAMVVHCAGAVGDEEPRRAGTGEPGDAFFDTDPRAKGPPVALAVPPRAGLPPADAAAQTLGPLREDVVHLGLDPLPEPHEDGEAPGDAALVDLAARVRADVDRIVLWGRWFAEPPDPAHRAVPLGEGWTLRLEQRDGEAWRTVRWGPCKVVDTEVSMHLRRGLSPDGTRVRWTFSVRLPPDLLPAGTEVRLVVADRPGLAPVAGTRVHTWAWDPEAVAPLVAD